MQMLLRQVKVNDGVLDFGMPEQVLNGSQVCSGFEQVRGVTVAPIPGPE
jgi:hypothetical protein